MRRRFRSVGAAVVAASALLAAAGCDDPGSGTCERPEVAPHLSPVNFGDLYVLGGGEEPDPATNIAVPYEWVLLLQSKCSEPVVVSEICLLGNDRNAFTVEGPVPSTVPFQREGAIRITYDSEQTTSEPDSVALVIQSNAANFPTLVVPVCARTIPKGQEKGSFECESPITVPPGTQDLSLCQ